MHCLPVFVHILTCLSHKFVSMIWFTSSCRSTKKENSRLCKLCICVCLCVCVWNKMNVFLSLSSGAEVVQLKRSSVSLILHEVTDVTSSLCNTRSLLICSLVILTTVHKPPREACTHTHLPHSSVHPQPHLLQTHLAEQAAARPSSLKRLPAGNFPLISWFSFKTGKSLFTGEYLTPLLPALNSTWVKRKAELCRNTPWRLQSAWNWAD